MKLLEKILKKQKVKTFLSVCAIYAVMNSPQFISTYSTPRDQLKPTLGEHISSEMNSLRDISGGATYMHFRLAGSTTGYLVKKLAN
jgi:hypothetical protein